jgi:5-carboxymethyl-2-hydroxymuconate isomerase
MPGIIPGADPRQSEDWYHPVMPHIIIEYSANLEPHLPLSHMLDAVHSSALKTGVFPIGGLRTRAQRVEHYRIADLHPDNSFIHVTLKIGHGRDHATQQRACETIFEVLREEVKAVFAERPLGLSMELQELHPTLNFKHNNLHDYVKQRSLPAGGQA